MVTLKAFKAFRPRRDLTDKIAALPYDVYNEAEARAEVLHQPDSFLAVDRAETSFPEGTDPYSPQVYRQAGKLLWQMAEQGKLLQDSSESLYLYELTMNGRSQTGIVGLASVDDYCNGVIKKHENTRADKEEDRVRHVTVCNAHTGPIFLAYRSTAVIQQLVADAKAEEPVFDFTSPDGIRHRGWQIEDTAAIEQLTQAFGLLSHAYIADGHHRAASAVRVALNKRKEHPDYTGKEDFNYFLSVFFPDEELYIMDYNRVVRDLNGRSKTELLTLLQREFTITPLPKAQRPTQKGSFSMLLGGKWYLLSLREPVIAKNPVDELDVSILQNQVLGPLFGIGNPKTDPRIDFVGGIRGLEELERRVSTDMAVAFALYPTSIGELFNVADAGLLMPPKSTWFEPKLRSGLFIHKIEE